MVLQTLSTARWINHLVSKQLILQCKAEGKLEVSGLSHKKIARKFQIALSF